jgi:tetratricopeptide (TPR) repeat protein/DNA-binding winged helix-turn-helix (wHTH) protein
MFEMRWLAFGVRLESRGFRAASKGGSPGSSYNFYEKMSDPSVSEDPPLHDAYRFDHFEVRVLSETLLCDNERVKIQALPFRLLLVLLENAGNVVTIEELGRRLGGPMYQVELGSLRVAATKLREALGDNAMAPRFVKTISGQGYKFIANVMPVDDRSTELSLEFVPNPALPAIESFSVRRISSKTVMVLLVAGAVSMIAFMAGFLIYRESHIALAGEHDLIVLGGFTNSSGDHDMDGTLSSAFRVKLQESPYLNLVSDRKFRTLVKDPEVATLNDELNACRTLRGQILLRGQLASRNPGNEVALTAWACSSGRKLTTQKSVASTKADILPALNIATEQMRRRLGEPDNSLQRFNVPLNQATTSSLVALRAFTQGEDKRAQGLESDSISDYKLAADLDPQFALAYARLGAIYFNAGEYVLSRQYFQKAFDLRTRTTDRERLYITANYYGFATGEVSRATEAYELWRKVYPQDMAPVNNLAIEYLLIGQPEKAVELARTAIQLDTTIDLANATWTQVYLEVGDYASVNGFCKSSLGEESNTTVFHVLCFQGAFAQNDEAGMQHQLQWARGKSQETLLLQEAANVAVSRGKAAEAWRLFDQAKESALQNNLVEFAAGTTLNKATSKADVGYPGEARHDIEDALKLAPNGPQTQGFAALALARAGETALAQAEAGKAAAQSPLDTILNSSILASVRAAIHLQKHEPEEAVRSLDVSRVYDFNEFMQLAPSYYRGLAYLQMKQPKEAAAEFQRVIDHRIIAPDSLYVELSTLELGHSLQLIGDTSHARLEYEQLEKVWRDADPDFPPLRQMHRYEQQLPR